MRLNEHVVTELQVHIRSLVLLQDHHYYDRSVSHWIKGFNSSLQFEIRFIYHQPVICCILCLYPRLTPEGQKEQFATLKSRGSHIRHHRAHSTARIFCRQIMPHAPTQVRQSPFRLHVKYDSYDLAPWNWHTTKRWTTSTRL